MNSYYTMKRNQLLWSLACLALSLLLSALLMISARAQEEAASKKAPSPLELTTEEKTARDAHLQELIPTRQAINQLLDKALATDDEDKALGYWARGRALYMGKLLPASERFNTWLAGLLKTHKCPSCSLQGDKLVPAPMPGQTPAGTN